MARRIGYNSRYYLPPGYYDADWSYYTPKRKTYRIVDPKYRFKYRPGMLTSSFWLYKQGVDYAIRSKYYADYYKNTGKRPRYYNKAVNKKVRW